MPPREMVRASFVALIKAAKTSVGDNVFNMRDFNFSSENMPAINVSTQSETLEQGHDYSLRRRILTVDVECYATEENGARCVDQLAWEVENVFHANPHLNNKVESCRLQNIAFAFGDNGVLALHGAILTFEVIYVTNIPDADEGNIAASCVEPFVGFDPETGVSNEDKYQKIEGFHARAAG
ncbi:hypothetical protein [Bartonella sp. cb54]|uniref:hypothetical protein n=1 Tax=Bartonella sp. cb54 TaxID=3385560 RepID=UPI0039A5A2F0